MSGPASALFSSACYRPFERWLNRRFARLIEDSRQSDILNTPIMRKITPIPICATLLCFLAIHSPAFAASFDCAKASKPHEKLICDDPVLSDLDSQLWHMYQERRSLLSAHGAELLKKSEQNWLRFAATICPVNLGRPSSKWSSPQICLQTQYRDRLSQLSMVGQKQGPFVFNHIDLFVAGTRAVDNGATPDFSTQHVGYPQIDNFDTPAVVAWNKQAERKISVSDCGDDGDDSTDYEISYATDRMISIRWDYYTYCHGTPHGFGGTQTQNLVLEPSLRKFVPADLFGTTDGWIPKLQSLFWDALSAQGWKPGKEEDKTEILKIVISVDRWVFTEKGMTVSFNAYEGGCFACTPQPVTVSWEDLKPMISESFIPPH